MLDHFVNLGIETIWLSPYFKSPMRDMGYDVSNFVDIDPNFGTLEDFDELIRQMKKRGKILDANVGIYTYTSCNTEVFMKWI